jgi:glucose/arabinose dehydrogenase
MRLHLLVVACALAANPVLAATVPPGFTETLVTGGLSSPTAMQFAPDGRLFVCEQGGTLRVIKNGTLLPGPFLTLSVSSIGERGLLGVAFDPNFAANQFVYVYYTATTPTVHNRISRFTAHGDVAVGSSELAIFDLPTLGASNHNGGALAFGPDGKLYAAVGENAVASNSQSLNTLLGKMLRLNTDGSIPTDNPFYGSATGQNRAIWALGLRNPFTFAFDGAGTQMFINDVGQNTWEEIDDGIAGANYGWPAWEGYTNDPSFKSPRYAYDHSGACAITGGAFYSPLAPQFPADYLHDYFFADFCGGWIRKLDPAAGNSVVNFASGIQFPVDLKVGDEGGLYYLARGAGASTGVVNRIEWTAGAAQTELVRDAFGGTPGSALTAHVPDVNLSGNSWAVTGSTPAPTLGALGAGVTPGSGHLQATIDTGVADIMMGVDYRVGSGAGMGALAFRLTDTNNLLMLFTYLNELHMYRRQAGMWMPLISQPLPAMLEPGSVHRLQVRARGSTLEGWWDGTRLLQMTDSFQQTATRHGLDWNSMYDATAVYDNFQITANGPPALPPAITAEPASRMIASGQTATLSVGAAGTAPLSYQWYVGASGTTTAPIAGATANSYTTPALTSTGSYWARVTNASGTADSSTATITIGVAPAITIEPQSQTIASGQTAALVVVATGTAPLSYQWYLGTSGTTTVPIAGATGSSYTTPALVSTRSYWVRVTNGAGADDSSTATLTVPPPVGLLVQDTFAGTLGTALPAHLPDVNLTGNLWTLNGGTPIPTLMTNGVGVTAGSGHLQATIDSGVADIVMGIDYRVGMGPGMGALVFRLTDADNFLLLETYLNALHLYRRQAGMWVFMASEPLPATLVPGSTHRLEVRALGSAIEGWWDGVRLLQTTDMLQQSATRHGLDWNSAFDAMSIYADFQLSVNGSITPPSGPAVPASPGPANGATGVGTTATLKWIAAWATSYDVSFGTSDPPPPVVVGLTSASYSPATATATTYFWQVTAHNTAGATAGPVWSFTTASAATPPDLLVLDSFTGIIGTALTAHLPDVSQTGSAWTLNGGAPAPTLMTAGAGVTAGPGHLQVTIATGAADIVMGVDYHAGSGPGMGALVFRLTDANNFLLLETYLNALHVYRRQAGMWVFLASAPLPAMLTPGATHRLEVRTLGSAVEGWWDGVRLLQTTDVFQQTATRHGLAWNSMYDATSTYGNLQITIRP